MTTPIETHVINLARRTDRRETLEARLARYGIAAQFFEAVDAQASNPARLMAAFPQPSRAWPMLPGEMACALSHRSVWDQFLSGEGQVLCVLEDDVLFGAPLAALLADGAWVTPAHGVVKLDLNSRKDRKILAARSPLSAPQGQVWRLWSRRLGGGGYLAHRDVVARLRAGAGRMAVPVDHYLFNPAHAPHFTDPGVHVILPAPVFHDHTGSDLAPHRARQLSGADAAGIRRARAWENLRAIPGRAMAFARGARFMPLTATRMEED